MQDQHGQQQISGPRTAVVTVGGLAIGASLVGLMGFSFLASVTLLVVSSPLLLIFSPLLLFAGFVFAAALAGFAVATAMALAGLTTLGWIFEEIGGSRLLGFGGGGGGSGRELERLKEKGKDWAGYFQHGNELSSRG